MVDPMKLIEMEVARRRAFAKDPTATLISYPTGPPTRTPWMRGSAVDPGDYWEWLRRQPVQVEGASPVEEEPQAPAMPQPMPRQPIGGFAPMPSFAPSGFGGFGTADAFPSEAGYEDYAEDEFPSEPGYEEYGEEDFVEWPEEEFPPTDVAFPPEVRLREFLTCAPILHTPIRISDDD